MTSSREELRSYLEDMALLRPHIDVEPIDDEGRAMLRAFSVARARAAAAAVRYAEEHEP